MPLEPFAKGSTGQPISRSGQTITANVTLLADPVDADEAATKQYAENTIDPTVAGFSIRIPNRWYLPQMYVSSFVTGGIAGAAYCCPRFVGAQVRWSRVRICGASIDGTGTIELGLYALDTRTLRPVTGAAGLLWRSGLVVPTVNAVNTKTGVPFSNTHDETINAGAGVVSTTPWVGFAIMSPQAKGFNFSPGGCGSYFLLGTRQSDAGFGSAYWEQSGLGSSGLPTGGTWIPAGTGGTGVTSGVPRLGFMPSEILTPVSASA